MHLTDPIADMLTRIRNGNMARHTEVKVPFSKIKESMASVIKSIRNAVCKIGCILKEV